MVAEKRTEIATSHGSIELRGDREVLVSWALAAPPGAVFEAWTQAELVKRWWAPLAQGVVMLDCQADVRVGGRYRYVLGTPRGELPFSGKYLELTPPTRLVYTHVFEPMASAGELLVTVSLTPDSVGTALLVHELYPSAEVRAAALAAGAEGGRRETMNQLQALLRSLH